MNGQRFMGYFLMCPCTGMRNMPILSYCSDQIRMCPILSATLNPAACSFYWPISKDISPKNTITSLWLVKSLKWTSVSLDGFNSQKCLQQEVW